MEIVLIRHGQPEWVRDGINVGNPVLTACGHRQAAAVADALADEHFDEILNSPLVRARQTADPLRARHNRDELIDPWLEEVRDPNWHGTPQELSTTAYKEEWARPWTDRWRGLDHMGGERLDDFVKRIHAGCAEFLAARGITRADHELPVWHIDEATIGKRFALVAHGGTNSVTLCYLLGLTSVPWEWTRFRLMHASITRLETIKTGDDYIFSLRSLSNVEHLPASDRTE